MASRLIAAAVLFGAALVAWLTVASSLAARVLQSIVGLSLVYVAYLAYRGWQVIREAMSVPQPPGDWTGETAVPFITVVVPARDEEMVIGDVVRDLVGQHYGGPDSPRYEVLVMDEKSQDGTAEVALAAAEEAGAPEGLVRVMPADDASGGLTKGAALARAISVARGEITATVDADARLGPDFLAGVMAAWRRDPDASAIQARREPVNAEASWLTAAQGEEQLMDLASQCGRRRVEGTAELRGNGMFVRRGALDQVGGWNARAITEDLDLSTRLAAAGEHVALAPEVAAREEAVTSLIALWWQRARWAEGSLRRLLEHGPGLLVGPAPIGRKLDFLAFTGEFVIPPLFAASVVASLITVPLPIRMDWTVPASLFVGYGAGSLFFAFAGLAGTGVRGWALAGRAVRGALFLSHWLLVVPVVLVRIALGPATPRFRKTPRLGGSGGTDATGSGG
jgi:1,2-diacylglycerol 3-beta-glucosyltransferase